MEKTSKLRIWLSEEAPTVAYFGGLGLADLGIGICFWRIPELALGLWLVGLGSILVHWAMKAAKIEVQVQGRKK